MGSTLWDAPPGTVEDPLCYARTLKIGEFSGIFWHRLFSQLRRWPYSLPGRFLILPRQSWL